MSKPLRVAVSMSSIVNTLGALGVIGSLVFVGMELQQSRQIALGTQQQMRTELRAQLFIAPLEGNFFENHFFRVGSIAVRSTLSVPQQLVFQPLEESRTRGF